MEDDYSFLIRLFKKYLFRKDLPFDASEKYVSHIGDKRWNNKNKEIYYSGTRTFKTKQEKLVVSCA